MSLLVHADGRTRCHWPGFDPLYVAYHDTDWGVPERDDRALFEKLILDGFQAGLSWITILKKRESFRAAFAGFEPDRIARFGEADVTRLMADPRIVRNRAKIEGTIRAVRIYLDRQGAEPFGRFLWGFVGGSPIQNAFETRAEVPTETAESREMSKALKALGFTFVGPTITYAFMQAVGMVNDHMAGCYRHAECAALAQARA